MRNKKRRLPVFRALGNRFSKVIIGIEMFLAALIIITVMTGAIALIVSTIQEGVAEHLLDYDNFQNILSYLLILIIGLELAIMLIQHQPSNIIDVMIYATARKMLIYSTDMVDGLIGVISIGILFIIKVALYRAKISEDNSTKKYT